MSIIAIAFVVVLLTAMWYKLARKPSTANYANLRDKVVLITGASGGLGKACAFAFHKYGCKIILCSRNVEKLENVKSELESASVHGSSAKPEVGALDIADVKQVKATLDEIVESSGGKVDILINNAGISSRGSFLSTKLEVFEQVLNVNVMGQIAVTKAILPSMVTNKSGHIVGISSVQGKIALPNRVPYGASKHACQAFYDSLRAEVAHDGINVTLISPSYVKTDISVNSLKGDGSKLGEMDKKISEGMEVDYVAQEIVDAVVLRKKDVTIGPLLHNLAIYLRLLCPPLFFWIMEKRAKS